MDVTVEFKFIFSKWLIIELALLYVLCIDYSRRPTKGGKLTVFIKFLYFSQYGSLYRCTITYLLQANSAFYPSGVGK